MIPLIISLLLGQDPQVIQLLRDGLHKWDEALALLLKHEVTVTCDTLQSSINSATSFTTFKLDSTANCGPVTLNKVGGILTTNNVTPVNGRITLPVNYAKLNATIDTPAVIANDGVINWTLQQLEIIAHPDSNNHTVSFVGNSTKLIVNQCYIHGDSVKGAKVGVKLDSNNTIVTNSIIVDFKRIGQEAQAIVGNQGAGPFTIENNRIEGAGENILFGGDDPRTLNLVPSNIIIRNNDIIKPEIWRTQNYTVKNLLELKSARHVLIENNRLSGSWVNGQTGYGIVFTIRNQDGGCPWCIIEDVIFQNNTMDRVAGGFNILAQDDIHQSLHMKNVKILNNKIDIDGNGNGRTFQIAAGPDNLELRNNSITGKNINSALAFYGKPTNNMVVDTNSFQEGDYGIFGDGAPSLGVGAWNMYAPNGTWTTNTVFKGNSGRTIIYPPGTTVKP